MTPQQHSDALAEQQAEATKWALSVEGMLLQKLELAIRRSEQLDMLENSRAASIKRASDDCQKYRNALIAAIKALKVARE